MAGITAKEIAKLLGISPSAVSIALNGKSGIGEGTRKQVLETAEKLGYPLSDKVKIHVEEAGNIRFVVYVGQGVALRTTFSTHVLQGVATRATELGYKVELHYIYESKPIGEQLKAVTRDTNGIVLLGTDITQEKRNIFAEHLGGYINIPIVVVDNFLFAAYVDCVGNDNMFGSKAAVSHLIKSGHKNIGYLRSKQRITNFEDREVGVKLALEEHGVSNFLQVVDVDISAEKSYDDIMEWLGSGGEPVSAYYAENDDIAVAAIRAFTDCGYAIPSDVSIIGFDNLPFCEMTMPPLTTMHSYKEQLGEMSMNILQDRITSKHRNDDQIGATKTAISLKLIERGSVKNVL